MHARRDEEVARALRRGLGQDRRFDVLEAARIEPAAQCLHQADAGAHGLLHLRAAEVEVAVLQAHVLARVLVGVERQGLGLVEHLDGGRHDLDLAGADLVVRRIARAHRAGHAHGILGAQRSGDREQVRLVAFHQHLHDAFMVAHVDEGLVALDAGLVDPAANGDGLADEGLVNETAEMGAHGGSSGVGSPGRGRMDPTF